MDTYLFLVIGTAVLVLAIPAVIGALSESRPPRAAAMLVMIGGGLLILAVTQHPRGYAVGDIPMALTRVLGRYF